MTNEPIADFEEVLTRDGLHAGLKFLNARVPHRCTAVYRLDHNVLRLVALVDKLDAGDIPELREVALADSFCQFVLRDGEFVTTDSAADARLDGHPYKGVMNSYVGLPLTKVPGSLFGTFCHFDFAERPIDEAEFEFLQRIATILPRFL